jgi:hypothetical protein
MPLLVCDVQDRLARPMAGAVYQRVDPSPPLDRAIDESLEILTRLVRSGDAEAAEFGCERFSLAGGRQDRDLEAVRR